MRWYFGFFFVSGFCSILYELVWLRLAMAQFSVTTALVSIVLSAFMIGLGLGSWGAGRYLRTRQAGATVPALRLYAMTELLIGVSAILVPRELIWGRIVLEKLDAGAPLSVTAFYLLAGLWIALTVVPWCACMGATFPFAMAAIRENFSADSSRSFSYLYLANVLGAVTGAAIPLVLIELLGFKSTLHVGAILNFCLAATAFAIGLRNKERNRKLSKPLSLGVLALETPARGISAPETSDRPSTGATLLGPYFLLFATGFTSMGVEVVWIRLFTVALGTVVYAFAAILGLYLAATYVGSLIYRQGKFDSRAPSDFFLALLAVSVALPLLLCDPRLSLIYPLRVVAILPFSLAVGLITPMVLDRVSHGDPDRAGRGYAVNIAGCVLGPLVSGFVFLPLLGERFTLLIFALPWIFVSLRRLPISAAGSSSPVRRSLKPLLAAFVTLTLVFATKSFESQFTPREVRRDSTATVTAIGATRLDKQLLVNGMGMTGLTPITKMIAHLPLAFLNRPPKNALVICFGMGTTHRSMLSWGISSTAVELVPSVVSVFPFFHADARQLLASPLSHVVIDDGRFYMERSAQQYDVIVIDPPPPVEAAGSSLLYSKQFYAIARLHLAPGGILQQWYPQGSRDPAIIAAVAKSIHESFPYVRVFHSIEGWGYHFLASDSPLPDLSAAALASRLPPAAVTDLVEWGPRHSAEEQFAGVLNQELSLEGLIAQNPGAPALQDDRPVNEYFIVRRALDPEYRRRLWAHILTRAGIKS